MLLVIGGTMGASCSQTRAYLFLILENRLILTLSEFACFERYSPLSEDK
jgi:hypothetical protein